MREKIEEALEQIRFYLKMDGGDVELVDVGEDGVVKVKLLDACGGCEFAAITLQKTIEETLKGKVAGVSKVVAVVD